MYPVFQEYLTQLFLFSSPPPHILDPGNLIVSSNQELKMVNMEETLEIVRIFDSFLKEFCYVNERNLQLLLFTRKQEQTPNYF